MRGVIVESNLEQLIGSTCIERDISTLQTDIHIHRLCGFTTKNFIITAKLNRESSAEFVLYEIMLAMYGRKQQKIQA